MKIRLTKEQLDKLEPRILEILKEQGITDLSKCVTTDYLLALEAIILQDIPNNGFIIDTKMILIDDKEGAIVFELEYGLPLACIVFQPGQRDLNQN